MTQRHYTRVAVVQLAYHPAIVLSGRSPLEDPLFELSRPDSLLLEEDIAPALADRFAGLRARIRAVYLDQLRKKLHAILARCLQWDVRLVVLPEYSVPWQLLSELASASGQMVVVAGTHTVDREARKSGVYQTLGAPAPPLRTAVCPVLYRGRLLALQPKLNPARPEDGQMTPGATWQPIELPDGLPSPMGLLVCLDFLYRESDAQRQLVGPQLARCRFLAVPSLTPAHTLGEFSAKAWEEARRYGRPVLYSDTAGLSAKEGGGTSVFVDEGRPADLRRFPEHAGYLEAGEEGVIVTDIDLGYMRVGESTRYDWQRPVQPFAAASLVYGHHPAEASYARWLADSASELQRNDDDALDALSTRVQADERLLLDAMAMAGATRSRRLTRLVRDHANFTSAEEFRRLAREVVLPDDVLPLPLLQSAMASAASDLIFDWQRDFRGIELSELVSRLQKAGAPAMRTDAAERTEAGTQALSTVRKVLLGQPSRPAPEVPPPAIPVIPCGIDPASLGERTIDGLWIQFRARIEDFGRRESDELIPNDEPADSHNKRASQRERTKPLPAAEGAVGSVLWKTRDLLLLAQAEGRAPCAVVAISRSQPAGIGFAVVASGPERWELWYDASESFWQSELTAVSRALKTIGIDPANSHAIDDVDLARRRAALLPRFVATSALIAKRRSDKLQHVGGHFVELSLCADGKLQAGSAALDDWLDSPAQTALLLGEFGSGKSTLLAQWCTHLLTKTAGPLPLFVDLAVAPASADSLSMLLHAVGLPMDALPERAALQLLIRSRQVLPCFDGLDEMATRTGDTRPVARLGELLRVAEGGGKVLISSRDHYFSSEEEVKSATEMALREALGASAGFRVLTVQPLAQGQVKELIESTLNDTVKVADALKRIATTYDLTDLVQRPLLLAMVLQSLDRIDPSARVAPADVYEAYLQKWLAHTREDDASLSHEQKVRFAEALAEQLWRSGNSSCSWHELRDSVRDRIGKIRLPEHVPDAAAFLDIQGGAFFVRDGEDRYRFAHKSFLEYFLARSLVQSLPHRPAEALATRPLTLEVASFVGEILRRKGDDPRQSPALRTLKTWLTADYTLRSDERTERSKVAVNALRLLHGLGRWSGDGAGWLPEGADLRGLSLCGEDLRGAGLRSVRLSGSDLSGADLREADLSGADLRAARLVGVRLDRARLEEAVAEEADFSLVAADSCSLIGADLGRAVLTQSVWTGCNWTQTQLDGAELTLAVLDGGQTNLTLPPAVATCGVAAASVEVALSYRFPTVVSCTAWHPQESLLAIGTSDGMLSVWDTAASLCRITMGGQSDGLNALAWSPDGRTLASSSDDQTVKLWDAATGVLLRTMQDNNNMVRSVAYSPDGRTLASGSSDQMVRLWDAVTGALLRTMQGHENVVRSVAYSPDGRTLASGSDDQTVRLWDANTGALLRTLLGHENAVRSVAYSPDGRTVASGSSDKMVRLWDAATGAQLRTLQGHENWILSVAYSPDGRMVASGSLDKTVRLWDATTGALLRTLLGHERWVFSVAYSPNGCTVASGSDDQTVRLWDAATGAQLRTLQGHGQWIFSVAYGPDGRMVASGSSDNAVKLWDAATGTLIRTLQGHEKRIFSVTYSPDGRTVASGSSDNTVKLWDAATGTLIRTLQGHKEVVMSVAYSPDGSTLASGSYDKTVRLWDAATGALLCILQGHEREVLSVAYSPDGRMVASGSYDQTVKLWDVATGALLRTLQGHEKWVLSVVYSPDGRTVASASYDKTVRLWDAATGALLRILQGHEREVLSVAYSPDGCTVASGSFDQTVRLWDPTSGAQLRILHGHENWVISVAYSPDGRTVASGSFDQTARLWDVATGIPIATIFANTKQLVTLVSEGYFCCSGDACEVICLRVRSAAIPNVNRYLPLGGLQAVFEKPAYVQASLAGNPRTAAQRAADLTSAGFIGGQPWDGERHFALVRGPSPFAVLSSTAPETQNNPFRPGPAVDTGSSLPGREPVLAELQSLIGSRSPAILIGPRRSGKTSILRLLQRQLEAQRHAVYVTLEGRKIKNADDLALVLAPELAAMSREAGRTAASPSAQFIALFSQGPQPLFLIDEVANLHEGDATLFPWLRALGQERACLLLAGSPLDWVTVVRRASAVAPGSSFGNDLTPVVLGPMAEADALRFLIETARGQLPQNAARWIVEDCGPWPFYLQVMGHALFELARMGRRKPLLDRHAFRDVYEQRLLNERGSAFEGRWQELPPALRSLLDEHPQERPAFLKLPPALRKLLVDAGLCNTAGSWLLDRPFFDWIQLTAPLRTTS